MIEVETHLISLSNITIPEDRQRSSITEAEIETLSESILARGLINPIIVREEGEHFALVAGERRLRACIRLKNQLASVKDLPVDYSKIPARLTSEMEPHELKAIELEENIQRKDLTWQDEAVAYVEYYEAKKIAEALEQDCDPDEAGFTFASLAGCLHVSKTHAQRMVKVGRAVLNRNKEVIECDSARAAAAKLDRKTRREIDLDMSKFDMVELGGGTALKLGDLDLDDSVPEAADVIDEGPRYEIHQGDFEQFIREYEGPRFNFAHCDFPFGIGLHDSAQIRHELYEGYEDTEAVYWALCDNLIQAKTDDLLADSCHILFWFPMSKYNETKHLFRSAEFYVNDYPLIWMKSDKIGIIPDAERYPRRIYETAFIMSLGDRTLVKPMCNAAYAPSERRKEHHISHKPEVMLEEFLPMFIDDDSVVLDPACGGGTAISTTMRLGAKLSVGLDINAECCELARALCTNTNRAIEYGAQD
jgi:ParB/RepB/Spo0J family partition protein